MKPKQIWKTTFDDWVSWNKVEFLGASRQASYVKIGRIVYQIDETLVPYGKYGARRAVLLFPIRKI